MREKLRETGIVPALETRIVTKVKNVVAKRRGIDRRRARTTIATTPEEAAESPRTGSAARTERRRTRTASAAAETEVQAVTRRSIAAEISDRN